MDVDGTGRQALRAVGAGAAALVLAALTGCGAPPAAVSPTPAAQPVDSGERDFTDPRRWPSLPPLSDRRPLTTEDLAAALPGGAPWGEAQVALVVPLWQPTWCGAPDGPLRGLEGVERPRDDQPFLWASADAEVGTSQFLEAVAVRWEPTGEAGVAAARQWGEALRGSAADCPDAVVVAAPDLPGEAALLTVAPAASGTWAVQAVTTGGPTGLRLRATVTADSAEAAAAPVPGLMTTAIARLAAADDAASHTRDHPADRPALTAGHLLTDTDTGRPDRPADPPPVAGPVEDAARADGWCPESPLRGVPLPEQAWSTSWTEPGPFELGFDVMTVDERVLRFSGLGDEGGVAAARAYSAALRAGARACADAAADGRQVHVSDHGVEGDDSLVVAVDQGDGTWRATATARDGVTVLVVSTRVRWEGEWYDDAVIALTSQAWRRVHETDGTVR